MFNILGENKEIKAVKESETKQIRLAKGQDTFNSVANPQDDQIYMQREADRSDLLKWQQSLGDELTRLRHKLRNEELNSEGKWIPKRVFIGYKKDEEGNTFEIYENMKPLLNDLGIQMVLSECEPLISRNLINSNLDEDFIRRMLEHTSNTILDNLCDFYDDYNINELNLDHILQIVKNVIKPAPFRALKGWTKRMDNSMNKRIDAYTHTEDATQKGGFFQMFKGR